MKDPDLDTQQNLDRILSRDGFSPDYPERTQARAAPASLGLRLLMYMLKGIRIGSLDVTLPNGEQRQFRGSESGPHGVLNIRANAIVSRVLSGGEVGFGEAYLDGLWDSPDLSSLLYVMHANEPYYKGPYEKNLIGRFAGWVQHKLRANTKETAQKNIEYHYDLGNEFYKMWLDDTMAYSAGMFHRRAESMDAPAGMFIKPNETLMDAQLNKFQLMAERLDLRPEHHLLEIGSGWGGFAIHAARTTGCRVTSITLSKEQLVEAQRRAAAAGLADRISFELRDYRDVSETDDRVVSIEMYEAVGEEYWPGYFATIARALKPGGRAAIQGITINAQIFGEYRRKRDFIQKYIFPGGMLCPPELFQSLAAQAGLRPENPLFYARDYADTLAHWHRKVLAVRDRVTQQFDERFLRMWRYYLSYCECGFRVGSVDLMQITLRKDS